MTRVGGTDRRRICIFAAGVGDAVKALAETQGHQIVTMGADAIDLIVVDGDTVSPAELEVQDVPVLVVTGKRLKGRDVAALQREGAVRVLDRDSSILDLAFAFSDFLFGTRIEQRRYAKVMGGVGVEACDPTTGSKMPGQLLGIARCGATLLTPDPIPDGTRIEMRFELVDREVALRGRVAYTAEHEGEQHVGVEFALDDVEVAPKLASLMPWSEVPSLGSSPPLSPPL